MYKEACLWLRTPRCACLLPLPQPAISNMLHNLTLSLAAHCEPFSRLPFPITSCSKPFLLFSVLCLRGLIWWAIPTITPSLPSPKHISLFLGSSVSQLKGVMLITVIMCTYGKHNPQLRKLPACFMQKVLLGSLIHFLCIPKEVLFFFHVFAFFGCKMMFMSSNPEMKSNY